MDSLLDIHSQYSLNCNSMFDCVIIISILQFGIKRKIDMIENTDFILFPRLQSCILLSCPALQFLVLCSTSQSRHFGSYKESKLRGTQRKGRYSAVTSSQRSWAGQYCVYSTISSLLQNTVTCIILPNPVFYSLVLYSTSQSGILLLSPAFYSFVLYSSS